MSSSTPFEIIEKYFKEFENIDNKTNVTVDAEYFFYKGRDYIDFISYTVNDNALNTDQSISLLKKYNITDFTHIHSYGGEGMGYEYYTVYEFVVDGSKILVKFEGWYESYNGPEFERFYEVKPKEKIITVYERVDDDS